MTKRTEKTHAAADHSELLNGKRPDIDARLIRDITQARTDREINVQPGEPRDARKTRNRSELSRSTDDAA